MKSEVQVTPTLKTSDKADLLEAKNKSLLWHGLDPDERKIVIDGNTTLGQRRRRTLSEWTVISHAIELLDREIVDQCGNNKGKAYNKLWRDLTPKNIQSMQPSDRTHARWLWENKETIETWWKTVRPSSQDKWGHPLTIRLHYERAAKIGTTDPLREVDEDAPKQKTDYSARKRSAAAELDEQVHRSGRAVEDIREVVNDLQIVTGISPQAIYYDLSTLELAAESARNFWEVYSKQSNSETMLEFVRTLFLIEKDQRGESEEYIKAIS